MMFVFALIALIVSVSARSPNKQALFGRALIFFYLMLLFGIVTSEGFWIDRNNSLLYTCILAVILLVNIVVGLVAKAHKKPQIEQLTRVLTFFIIPGFMFLPSVQRILNGGEGGLLGWFALALIIRLVWLSSGLWPVQFHKFAYAFAPIAALCYAMGFDVLQPDPYSYVPAGILAALILVVAVTAFLRLAPSAQKVNPSRFPNPKSKIENRKSKILLNSRTFQLALYILSIAILVYAATFKVIDRGWLLPWSYMAAAGGLLFAASQLWQGLKTKDVPLWAQVAAGRLGELVMVVSAFFVYREFL